MCGCALNYHTGGEIHDAYCATFVVTCRPETVTGYNYGEGYMYMKVQHHTACQIL